MSGLEQWPHFVVSIGGSPELMFMKPAGCRSTRATIASAVVAVMLLCSPTSDAAAQQARKQDSSQAEFGGTYDRLRPEHRRLIDDWFAQYNKRVRKNIASESGYNAVPISIRTTFEAVTNALQTTSLSDKQGKRLGNALELVESLETAHGKIPRARGDLQFRIYVVLKPNALATLNLSREFTRGRDNTIFHHSYPLNYRQTGGDPSIQISCTPDGKRADIDVDYRSSGFPSALFNGHLTAQNSDVRAGNNYQGHLQRWAGLTNWWRNIFGLPVVHETGFAPDPEQDIARLPRLTAKAPLSAAVTDFLTLWLVQRKPNLALPYVSDTSYACVTSNTNSAQQEAGNPVPRTLWDDMEEVNFLMGTPASLAEAVAPVALSNPALLPIAQKGAASFTLVKVPDDIAAGLTCTTEASSQLPPRKYGKYYASLFRLRVPGSDDAPISLLWQKQSGYWQIVARQIDPTVVRDGPVPEPPEIAAEETLVTPEAPAAENHPDPRLMQRVESFFTSLLLKQDADAAFSYFAPSAYACINLALPHGLKPISGVQNEAESLRRDLQEIARRAPASQRLEDIIKSYDPQDAALRAIHQAHARAYMLTTISSREASALECAAAPEDGNNVTSPEYATFFEMIEPGDECAGLGLLWSKESGEWKIAGFLLDEP
jgi:hypothetical protein